MRRNLLFASLAILFTAFCGFWGYRVWERGRSDKAAATSAPDCLLAARIGGESFLPDTSSILAQLDASSRDELDSWTRFLNGDLSADPSGGPARDAWNSDSAFLLLLDEAGSLKLDYPVYAIWKRHRATIPAPVGLSRLSQGLRTLGIRLGESGVLVAADSLFAEVLRLDSADAQALAWKGSFLTVRALKVESPIEKVDLVQRGTREIERAVALDSTDLVVRNIRALNYLSLPGFFQTHERGRRDVEYLLQAWKSGDSLSDHALGSRKAVLDTGTICRMARAARAVLKDVDETPRRWLESNLPGQPCGAATPTAVKE